MLDLLNDDFRNSLVAAELRTPHLVVSRHFTPRTREADVTQLRHDDDDMLADGQSLKVLMRLIDEQTIRAIRARHPPRGYGPRSVLRVTDAFGTPGGHRHD